MVRIRGSISVRRGFAARGVAAVMVLLSAAGGAFGRPVVPNIPYESPGNSSQNFLDLYTPPEGVPVLSPTIVLVHGGSYYSGSKTDLGTMAQSLAARGYPTISMDYMLVVDDGPSYPQPIRDVKNVIRWIRTAGATQYQLPGQIVLVGESAGSTIAATAATANNSPVFETLPVPPGGYAVDGLVGMWGRYDLVWNASLWVPKTVIHYLGLTIYAPTGPQVYAEASAITYVSRCSPPTRLLAAADDNLVSVGNTVRLDAALVAEGVLTTTTIVPTGGHGGGFGNQTNWADLVVEALPAMLGYTFPPTCPRSPPPPPPPPPPTPKTNPGGVAPIPRPRQPRIHVELGEFMRGYVKQDLKCDLNKSGTVTAEDLFMAVSIVLNGKGS